ncbi:MAG: iron ABC transporter permease [Deltaproteobacteria bacterium]|nr:iron ABC transporter permease [Deltaproteobacteria bacterium]
MEQTFTPIGKRLTLICLLLGLLLAAVMLLGAAVGSSNRNPLAVFDLLGSLADGGSTRQTIIWKIRLPRVLLAAVAGATLSLGGLVFQVLLRNPLAEPYILGISGGAAVGAISGMLIGIPFFPGVTVSAFSGSMATLGIVLLLASGARGERRDSLLLAGVMMNAFAGALIMFLLSISQSSQLHHILFWLMGDLSMAEAGRLPLFALILPCYVIIFILARPMNILLTGRETATSLGVNVRKISVILLITATLMVSLVVCLSGLVGFVGLVIPHILRLTIGSDHRLLVPAGLLGGASYLVGCDLLARALPASGELPVGIITAMIGAPLFIVLLWRSGK